jgi:Class III cytochrome C family
MKLLYLISSLLIAFCTSSFGQIQNLKTHTQMNVDCKKCHICDTPTKADPCLLLCPRNKIDIVRHSPSEGPNNIIIDGIESENNLYGPANFTHKLHSEMSLMSGGCSTCHHFNPPGKIVKCSSCHEQNRKRTDLSVPDLKAAFHRQCMGCHKTWEEKSECESCHKLNSNILKSETVAKIEKVHPEITIPKKIVYETDSDEGNFVTYFHNDHSSLFGIECSKCHNQESCASCHAITKQKLDISDGHDRCSTCHDTDDKCNKCHKNEVTEPFNHDIKTEFKLSNYHAGLSCISCHKTKGSFSGLKMECISCHTSKDGYFNHDITGLRLDETHIELECGDCHSTNNYSKKPSCVECHDDDINYPDSIPGERTNK